MLGKIIAINESIVSVKLDVNIYDYDCLISKNVVFKDTDFMNIGEVIAIKSLLNLSNDKASEIFLN